MTPLPKKKHAKSRTKTRKSAISLTIPRLIVCPNCGSYKLPHKVCPHCKSYKTPATTKKTAKNVINK